MTPNRSWTPGPDSHELFVDAMESKSTPEQHRIPAPSGMSKDNPFSAHDGPFRIDVVQDEVTMTETRTAFCLKCGQRITEKTFNVIKDQHGFYVCTNTPRTARPTTEPVRVLQ